MSLPETDIPIEIVEEQLRTALHTSTTVSQFTIILKRPTENQITVMDVEVEWNCKLNDLPTKFLIHMASDPTCDGNKAEELQANDIQNDALKPLAALYNERLLHEMVSFERLRLPTHKYLSSTTFGNHFMVTMEKATTKYSKTTHTLNIDQIIQVAESLAQLHSFCLSFPDAETKSKADQNFAILQKSIENHLRIRLKECAQVLENEMRKRQIPTTLTSEVEMLSDDGSVMDFYQLGDHLPFPSVLCHGNLSPEYISFDQKLAKIHAITGWDFVHYGTIVEDFVHLLVRSLSPEERRQNYGKILKHYYYSLGSKT